VPFDGERHGTSAELLGGPERAHLLGGEARQAVEQVMHFENNQVDQPGRTLPLDILLDLPRLAPQAANLDVAAAMFERVRQMARAMFSHARPAIAPRP